MNILIFNWRGPRHPHAGGAEIATLEHAKYWISKGHSVTWFTSSYWGCDIHQETIDGVKIIRKANQILGVHLSAAYWYLFENRTNFDIVIDQFHGIPFFTPLFIRKPKLGYIHEATKDVWKTNQLPQPFNLIPSLLGESIEKLIFTIFYKKIKFMTVSNSTKKDLVAFGLNPKNIAVIHNGLYSIELPGIKKNKMPTLLSLGALAKDKGTDNVLYLFDMLHNRHPNWVFLMAGKATGEYRNIVSKKKHIKYLGFVSEKKKNELYKKSHLLINLSMREGWGLTNLEANSQGTPVIGFNVPGIKDSVLNNKTGILVENGKIDVLSNKIEELIEDKRRYNLLSKNALVWSRKFTWKETGKQSLDYLQEVLASNL